MQPTRPAEEPSKPQRPLKSTTVSPEERLDALSRASHHLHLRDHECRRHRAEVDGTLPNGERIPVKYGRSPEIPSEVASARLLHALGFGADEVMLVEKLRCQGCPAEPFIRSKGFVGFRATPVPEWVRVFKDKVRQITEGPSCPQ